MHEMIAKISKGKGFRGVIVYISGKSGSVYITGNVSENPRRAVREMEALRRYSRCKTPVWHCSLSLSPEDRSLSDKEFADIAERFLKKMGLDGHQYTVYKHTDREHPHIHIVCNRIEIKPKHRVWNPWQDIKRAREAKTELEAEFNLQRVPHNPQFAHPEISRGEREEARRKKIIPSKQYVAECIAEAAAFGNLQDFIAYLQRQNIKAVPNIAKTGRMNGFSFVCGDRHYKGSQVRCSWATLSTRLQFDPARDNRLLYSLTATAAKTESEEKLSKYCIYSVQEWKQMGGIKDSNYKRAYKMLSNGYALRSVATEIRLQCPNISEQSLKKILTVSAQLWINNNRDKLSWAYSSRRRSFRFSQDPIVLIMEVLALLVIAAVCASINGLERHSARQRISNLSDELEKMYNHAEDITASKSQDIRKMEREEPLIDKILDKSQTLGRGR